MATLSVFVKDFTAYSRTFVDGNVATGTEIITIPDHNLQNGDVVRFTNSGGALPGGLESNHPYFVIGRTQHTFKVSATSGGSAVNITSAAGGGTHTVTLDESKFNTLFYHAAADKKAAMIALSDYFLALAGGYENGSVDLHTSATDPVAASGVITLASVDADDTITIGGVTLTAKASPATEAEFSQAGNDTADAASLVTCINTHSVLGKMLLASNVAGAVTITSRVKGQIGNLIEIATSNGTRLAITGGATTLTGGTGGPMGAATTYNLV